MDFLGLLRKHRVRLLKQEIKETSKLIAMQKVLNELYEEEKEIKSS